MSFGLTITGITLAIHRCSCELCGFTFGGWGYQFPALLTLRRDLDRLVPHCSPELYATYAARDLESEPHFRDSVRAAGWKVFKVLRDGTETEVAICPTCQKVWERENAA